MFFSQCWKNLKNCVSEWFFFINVKFWSIDCYIKFLLLICIKKWLINPIFFKLGLKIENYNSNILEKKGFPNLELKILWKFD